MLKQIIKIVLNFIEHVHYPSFFVQFICFVTSYLGASLYDAYVKKENVLEKSLELTLSFMTSVDTRVEDLVSKVNYLKNWCCDFIQKKYGRKNFYCTHTQTFYTIDDS